MQAKSMVISTNPGISKSLDAMNVALQSCPSLDHSIALLAYAIAITVLSQTAEDREAIMMGLGQCVRVNLNTMDHAAGGVPMARMQ